MALFGFGKKKETAPACACNAGAPVMEATAPCCCGSDPCTITGIKVLGAGCKSCHDQWEACRQAAAQLGMGLEVEYITDMEKVMAYNVMSMPAIVVNEQVVSAGRTLKADDVTALLKKLGYCK